MNINESILKKMNVLFIAYFCVSKYRFSLDNFSLIN